jgi:5-methylthioadenosine/S-adenosylhomocysteine deaminase
LTATWLLGGLCLLPDGGGHRAERADIQVSDGKIAAVLRPRSERQCDPHDSVVDSRALLIVPGFVNAHTHSPDNLIKGTTPNLPLELWSLHSASGREGRTPREIYISALLGCIELMRTGTTTVLDHIRFSPAPNAEGLDAVARAYRDSGLRAVIAPVVADRAAIDTIPLDPEDLPPASQPPRMMPPEEQLALIAAFIDRWHDPQGRLRGAIGPSGPQRCSDRLLELSGDLSRRRTVVLHSHVLETKAQKVMGLRLYGEGMVRHLDRLGMLTPLTNLVHLIWADSDDLDVVARSGAAVIHNPVSNVKLGSGTCALPGLLRRGISVGLGTDSACCNDSNNLLETAKWTALLHNLSSHDADEWIGPERALTLATSGGAAALGLGDQTGRIAVGMAADLTLFRLGAPGMAPLNNPVRQLIQSESVAAIDKVMVAGQFVMENGRCLFINQDDVWGEAQELAERRLHDNADVYETAAALAEPIKRMYRRLNQSNGRA